MQGQSLCISGEMRISLCAITPQDAIKLIRPQDLHKQTENCQTNKELLVKRTRYIKIIFAFVVLTTF
jgi:hypothetical protein